jgi:phage major head subunit gpT-like protein
MIVNAAALQSIYRSFRVLAVQAMAAAKPQYQRIATVVPSTTKQEEYGWLGDIPGMREWVGERVVQNLQAHGYAIKNKPFELTVGIDRDDIEDDSYGVYKPLIEMMGDSAAMHPDRLVFALLKAGFTTLCYDGQYFFDADHKDGDGPVQSNKGTAAFSATAYAAARAAMQSLKKQDGTPIIINPNLLAVGPQNDAEARKVLFAEQIDGTSNTMRNTAELMVIPELTTEWALMDTTKPIKPLIFQNRKNPEFVTLDSPTDENVFMKKKILYGIDMRCNAGLGLWQLAYGSTGTGE